MLCHVVKKNMPNVNEGIETFVFKNTKQVNMFETIKARKVNTTTADGA